MCAERYTSVERGADAKFPATLRPDTHAGPPAFPEERCKTLIVKGLPRPPACPACSACPARLHDLLLRSARFHRPNIVCWILRASFLLSDDLTVTPHLRLAAAALTLVAPSPHPHTTCEPGALSPRERPLCPRNASWHWPPPLPASQMSEHERAGSHPCADGRTGRRHWAFRFLPSTRRDGRLPCPAVVFAMLCLH